MAYFGKVFKLDRQENFEDLVNSFSSLPDEIKKQVIADKPTIKIEKNGDTYTQTDSKPDGSVRSINFKSGVEFDETIAPGIDSKTTITVSGNTITQVNKTAIATVVRKGELSDNECVVFSENTFKQYYYATPEASDEEGTLAGKVKQAIAKKRSANDIDGFFEKQKKKLKLKKKSSSVARSSSGAGGVAYITSNNDEGADASHLVKIEIYDLNRIKNVVPSEQWKLADVRVKYYADCEEDKHLQSARDVIFNITKLLASKQDCSNYFIDIDKSNKKYSD